MKFSILSAHESGEIDGTVSANLLNRLPNLTTVHDSNVVIVPVSWYSDYKFNKALTSINKPYVLVDFMELGLDWDPLSGRDGHKWGTNSADFNRLSTPRWMRLDAHCRDNPPLLTFCRELLEREQSDRLLPVSFPCVVPIPGIQTKEEFDARPLEAFLFWGLSHESRPRLHGDIFRNSYWSGYEVISQFDHWNGFFSEPRQRTWASIHAPHWDRKPMADVQHFIHRSKISISLPGAGALCFRDCEVAAGSIPAYWNSGIARSYPWEAEKNCILLTPGEEWQDLQDATQQDNLYELYVSAQENIRKYEAQTYVDNYIVPNIAKHL